MRLPIIPLTLGILTVNTFGQAPPASNLSFEVASVKLTDPGSRIDPMGREGSFDPQSVTFRGAQLIQVIRAAYGLDFDRISGPAWLYDERYDILARTPPGTTRAQANLMLQNLLAERFKLTLHHVSKNFPAYELTLAKDGHRLKDAGDPNAPPSRPGDVREIKTNANGFPDVPPGVSGARGNTKNGVQYMTFRAQSLDALLFQLRAGLGETTGTNRFAMGNVVDHTGLTGKYDFTLYFAGMLGPGGLNRGPSLDANTDPAPDIFQALEKQLGLKLTKSTTLEDTIVIDHIEKLPTEN